MPIHAIAPLMQGIALPEHIPAARASHILHELLDDILNVLADRGVPDDALAPIGARFSELLGLFAGGALSGVALGTEIVELAQELSAIAGEQGVGGLPAELLEQIGLNPEAIERLRGEHERSGLEIALLAQTIIGAFAPHALPAGPPTDVPGLLADRSPAQGPPFDPPAGPPAAVPAGPPAGVPGEGDDGEETPGRPRGRP